MKITKQQLKQIIKEELQSALKEISTDLNGILNKLFWSYDSLPDDPERKREMAEKIAAVQPDYAEYNEYSKYGAEGPPLKPELEKDLVKEFGITPKALGDPAAAAAERAAWFKSKEPAAVSRASKEDDPTRKRAAAYAARSGGLDPYGDPESWKVPGG